MTSVIELDAARTPAMRLGQAILEATLRDAPEALSVRQEDGIVVALDPSCLVVGKPILHALADAGIAGADRSATGPICVPTTVPQLLVALRARGLNASTIGRLELSILTMRASSPRDTTLFMVAGEGALYVDHFLCHTVNGRARRGLS